MATTNFVDGSTLTDDEWFNDTDALVYDVFSAASTVATARSTLGALTAVTGVADGNNLEFTIPSGVNKVIFSWHEFQANDASNPSTTILIQLADSGGYETSGYKSTSRTSSDNVIPSSRTGTSAGGEATDGFAIYTVANTSTYEQTGHITLTHVGSNKWVESHTLYGEDVGAFVIIHGAGVKTLSAELTTIKIFEDPAGATNNGQCHCYIVY